MSAGVQISIQAMDFNVGEEYASLQNRSKQAGAIVMFTGLVRDFNAQGGIDGLFLEHYPGMTEKTLKQICSQAVSRWDLSAITVIHRIGALLNSEQIVMVGVAATHRANAFDAAQFVMDFLKTEAPFWKKEILSSDRAEWVDEKENDQRARDRWL